MDKLTRVALAALAPFAFGTAASAVTLTNSPDSTPPTDLSGAPRAHPAGEWPQAHSDLKADPAIRFGALPNGMRYAIMRNQTPPGQVSMRLHFDVGSLMEHD